MRQPENGAERADRKRPEHERSIAQEQRREPSQQQGTAVAVQPRDLKGEARRTGDARRTGEARRTRGGEEDVLKTDGPETPTFGHERSLQTRSR